MIAQFYATLWYSRESEGDIEKQYINFAIQGETYRCSYKRFGRILGFDNEDMDQEHMHAYERPRLAEDMAEFHMDVGGRMWVTSNLKPYYRYLMLLARQTLLPKGGDVQSVTKDMKKFLALSFQIIQ